MNEFVQSLQKYAAPTTSSCYLCYSQKKKKHVDFLSKNMSFLKLVNKINQQNLFSEFQFAQLLDPLINRNAARDIVGSNTSIFLFLTVCYVKRALQCVLQQRGGSSALGSGGDSGCPTEQSVLNMFLLPPSSDET